VNRFEIVGSRSDERTLSIDISYRDSAREMQVLTERLAAISDKTGIKQTGYGSEDSQRYAFARLLAQMLQFSDEGHFTARTPIEERQKKLRSLAGSVTKQMQAIVSDHRRRKVLTVSCRRPDDLQTMVKTVRKILSET
jgi:hypothetical protein